MGLFSYLFKSTTPNSWTKQEYWTKWEFNELIEDIEEAHHQISKINPEGSNLHLRYFIEGLEQELFEVTHDNAPDFCNIWHWFRPSGEWSQWMNNSNEALRERIYFRSNRWKNEALIDYK